MTIKFNKTRLFNAAKETLSKALANPEANEKELASAYQNYFDVMETEIVKSVSGQVNNEMLDRSILQQRGQNVLTSEETKFFAAAVAAGGFTDDAILPETTQERVFEDLTTEHPLLVAFSIQTLGALTRFIDSDATKTYAWGPLLGGYRWTNQCSLH